MTKQELLDKLKECKLGNDLESQHIEADDLLLEYINDPDITKEYNSWDKWYS